MTDVARQKFAALMAEVESLEDTVSDVLARCQNAPADQAESLQKQLLDAQRQLAEKRTELQRISDGCGKPRIG